MLNSIIYFEENCIKNFEELEDKFLREPTKFAEYIYGLTEELHRLGLIMIQEAEAAGLEQDILMSSQIILSEKNRHEQIGKYVESITHSIAIQKKKEVWFNPHIWGL